MHMSITNSSSQRWHLANYAVKDHDTYVPLGGLDIASRAKKSLTLRLNNIPGQWPNKLQKTHVAHMELVKSRQQRGAVHQMLDVFIQSELGQISEWQCETTGINMQCVVVNGRDGLVMDLVIATGR